MAINLKSAGTLLIVISVLLLAILAYIKAEVDVQSAFLCDNFHQIQSEVGECPVHKSNISWFIVSAFGISFFLLGLGVYMLFMPKTPSQPPLEMKKDFLPVDLSKLDEEEKSVYGLLKKGGGSAYQSDIIRDLSISKAKATRILDRLETKGIAERKRRGMANIIVLK